MTSSPLRVASPVECLYLTLMERWIRTAPGDGCVGELDGVRSVNSQQARLAYLLDKIAAGAVERTFSRLAQLTQRSDGHAYISKDSSWMREPVPLFDGWHLEGCMSMLQKEQYVIRTFLQLGLSPGFVQAATAFVAGKGSVAAYCPTPEEERKMIAAAEAKHLAEGGTIV